MAIATAISITSIAATGEASSQSDVRGQTAALLVKREPVQVNIKSCEIIEQNETSTCILLSLGVSIKGRPHQIISRTLTIDNQTLAREIALKV